MCRSRASMRSSRGGTRALAPGARVAFLDNRYVEGSSTSISRTDADGNTYQTRKLDDGSAHEVLKNFPTQADLIGRALRCGGTDARVEMLSFYWLLTFDAKERIRG